MCVYTTGPFAIHHHTKPCSSVTTLPTESECYNVKLMISSDKGVQADDSASNPSGCSRYKGTWYFNSDAQGKLDGVSEPICKATPGKTTCLSLNDFKI